MKSKFSLTVLRRSVRLAFVLALKSTPVFMGVLATMATANASILVDQANPVSGFYVGASSLTNFSADLAAEPGGYTIGSIANSADVAAATSVLVMLRNSGDVLSVDEKSNLSDALSAGKNVVLIGEWYGWGMWDNSILGFAGGATVAGASQNAVTPVVNNALTAGVSSIQLIAAGHAVGGSGGTSLFTENFATLWGANLLTVLDINVFDDNHGNIQWEQNVADYLAAPVSATPLSASLPLFASGLSALGLLGWWRKRKGQAAAAPLGLLDQSIKM